MTEPIPVIWENPPTPSKNERQEFADILRANPFRWAVYPWPGKVPHSTANNIRSGALKAFQPPKSFEAVSTGVKDNPNKKVWVRYVGPPVEMADQDDEEQA